MKTRKKIPKETLRSLLLWKLPKRTRKHVRRNYTGKFRTDSLYTEPMVEVYSRKRTPKKIVPLPLKKKQSYIWRISGGMFMRV